jgi:uncharacterized membrane protein
MNEQRIRQIFKIGILWKAAHALIECAGGILLAAISTQTVVGLVKALTQSELIHDPNDLVANRILDLAQQLSVGTQHFYALYLLSHGAVKVILMIGLLRDRPWAYPASLAALGLFVVYQLYRYSYTRSLGLVLITVFDLVLMALIWHEYRVVRRPRGSPSAQQ